ncbi:type II toxin-antitoxin system VapC family toxin [Candidatus Bathyarchaeota archaeon]|nr:type II toxin-antitoxin system VapC family toxin [Candidatus Bathyarchaeota archaeon]
MPTEAYLIDSFAWLEYFSGSTAGARAKPFIESSKGITPTIVIAEMSEKYRRENLVFDEDLDFIVRRTRIIPLDTRIAEKAGALGYERKLRVRGWGLADSIILATAREHGAKIVTGDEHFRDLVQDAITIK